ncbi:acetyltransferase [Paenibacillus sp. JSM ZJ436]|uniref:acetyltransferase n=1 Tax=Paenibacillus sp. JSM ZJ436 TaxID=3376190 RepID=UPI0037B39C37
MNNKLMIIGAGGHGKVCADIAMKMDNWSSISFLDDNESITTFKDIEVIGTSSEISEYIREYDVFIAVGDNVVRQRLQQELESLGAQLTTLIHPSAVIGEQVQIGIGSVVMAGAVINCCTQIGKGCIINTSSSIDHDNTIGDYVHISPGVHLAGTVDIGHGSWLGIGSTVSNNLKVVEWCTIGAGSVMVRDITEPGVYVGIPVRRV